MSNVELFKSENGTLSSIRVLSEGEFNFINENSRILMEFQRHHSLIEFAILNYNSLCDLFSDTTKQLSITPSNTFHYPFDNFYLEANSVILNFLASSRTFLDHMETHIKKKFTENSPQYNIFRDSTVKEFDSKFSYRLMGKLRNFVTHCGMPPLSYDISKKLNHEESFMDIDFKLFFMRKELLEEYDGWGGIVKKDLKEQDSLIPAFGLFNEYVLSLIKIYVDYTKNFLFPDVVKAKENLLGVINESDGFSSNVYHYGEILPNGDNDKAVNIKIATIPLSLLKKVYHFESLSELIDKNKKGAIFQYGALKL